MKLGSIAPLGLSFGKSSTNPVAGVSRSTQIFYDKGDVVSLSSGEKIQAQKGVSSIIDKGAKIAEKMDYLADRADKIYRLSNRGSKSFVELSDETGETTSFVDVIRENNKSEGAILIREFDGTRLLREYELSSKKDVKVKEFRGGLKEYDEYFMGDKKTYYKRNVKDTSNDALDIKKCSEYYSFDENKNVRRCYKGYGVTKGLQEKFSTEYADEIYHINHSKNRVCIDEGVHVTSGVEPRIETRRYFENIL